MPRLRRNGSASPCAFAPSLAADAFISNRFGASIRENPDGTMSARPFALNIYLMAVEEIMHILGMLIVGLVAGALAKLIMPGRQGGGMLVTMLLGVAGAFAAGFLGRAVGWYDTPGEGPGLIASTLGALAVLAVYGLATRRALHR